jgi:release factor glutamine methyltransferase
MDNLDIYLPDEDSHFFVEVLSKRLKAKKNETALDMGSGSGIIAQTLIDLGVKKKNLTLVDLNSYAIIHLKKYYQESKVIKSNLFSKVKGKYDIITFNPPYLPANKYDKEIDTTGGKKGDEAILKFLKKLKKHLKDKGICFLLTSSLTPMAKIEKQFKKLKVKKIATKKLFFEDLYIYKITP